MTADEHGRVPALVLEWRQSPGGMEARVVRPVLDMEDEKWRVREEWLPDAPNMVIDEEGNPFRHYNFIDNRVAIH